MARLLRGREGKGRATKKKGLFLKFIFDKKKFLWQRTKNFFCGFPKKRRTDKNISEKKTPEKHINNHTFNVKILIPKDVRKIMTYIPYVIHRRIK